MNEYKGMYCDLTGKIINAAQCRTYLRMLDLPTGLVLNFGFPSMSEGIEHVSNPRATAYKLQDSETPSSESNKKGQEQ